jgi:hypothetical protein
MKMRDHRWYDPHHEVMDGDSTYYAEGAFYAVSGRLIDGIVRSGLVPRLGGSEGMFLHLSCPKPSYSTGCPTITPGFSPLPLTCGPCGHCW